MNNANSNQSQQAGCLNRLLPILIVGVVAFWFLQKRQLPPVQQGPIQQSPEQSIPRIELPESQTGGIPSQRSRVRKDNSDWSIEQVEGTAEVQPRSEPTATSAGDWSIEEVDSTSRTNDGEQDNQQDVKDAKSTTKGDWEIEEVESGTP